MENKRTSRPLEEDSLVLRTVSKVPYLVLSVATLGLPQTISRRRWIKEHGPVCLEGDSTESFGKGLREGMKDLTYRVDLGIINMTIGAQVLANAGLWYVLYKVVTN
jgi:hypothetical protein